MQSVEQYENSYKELTKISKSISMDQVIINFNRLDGESSEIIRSVLTKAIADRKPEVWKVIEGVK